MLLILLSLVAQDTPRHDAATQLKLRQLTQALSAAQKAEDESAIHRIVQESKLLLGSQAGLPETADEYRSIPDGARRLQPDELSTAYDPYLDYIQKQTWWKIGLDPTTTNHALREVASVIQGCIAARQVSPAKAEQLLKIAREAGDFLIWVQDQAGTGVLPFPAVRNGKGRPFEVAEQLFRKMEKDGKINEMIQHGWVVHDFDDGGLQFDHGLAGVALIRLYEATQDKKYQQAASRAADWVAGRRVVTNWNYNSFSVYLLAEVYRSTGEKKYLEAARKKAKLGVLPGQLTEGPRAGRWADAHNARPAYHYIMIRGLAALAAALPDNDPDRPKVIESIRLALLARNPDFQKGILNADSVVESLVYVKNLPAPVTNKLSNCHTDEALDALERYFASGLRVRKSTIGPEAAGLLLAYRAAKGR